MSEVERLATVLDGTDAAIYAYGLAAGRLTGAEVDRALSDMAAQRSLRDYVRERIISLGGTPGAAAAAYDPPFAVDGPTSARRLAALVEDRLAGQWAAVAAASTGAQRTRGATFAQECGVRQVTWSGSAPVWNGST